MLEYLGFKEASEHVVRAIEEVLEKEEYRTGDLGGKDKHYWLWIKPLQMQFKIQVL